MKGTTKFSAIFHAVAPVTFPCTITPPSLISDRTVPTIAAIVSVRLRFAGLRHVSTAATRSTGRKIETAAPVANQYLRFGSSPRGAQTLLLAGKVQALTAGRFNVSLDDIQVSALAALRHRLILNFEAEAEGITTDHIITQILSDVPREATVAV